MIFRIVQFQLVHYEVCNKGYITETDPILEPQVCKLFILDEKDDQEVEPSSWNAWNAWNAWNSWNSWNSWNAVYSEARHRSMLHQPGLPINLKYTIKV